MSGFPTLLFRSGDKSVIADGHRTFETYRRGIEQLLGAERLAPSEAMRAKMETLAAAGRAEKSPARGGEFWALARYDLQFAKQTLPPALHA